MAKKKKIGRGKKKWEVYIYFWFSSKNGRRIGFFFPSRKRALEWRDQQFWRYVRYPQLWEFLDSVDRNHIKEEMWWNQAKEYVEDITLEKAKVTYMGDKFKDPTTPHNVNRAGVGFH